MKKIILTLALASSSLLLNSCATNSSGITAQAGVTPYPLKTCVVTDSKLGSMGDPVTKIYNGQEIKFCCAPCVKKFENNQAKYLAKLK